MRYTDQEIEEENSENKISASMDPIGCANSIAWFNNMAFGHRKIRKQPLYLISKA